MGKFKNGFFGGITGSINNLVFYQLNGQNVVRSKPVPSLRPPTPKQLNNRMQLQLLSAFLSEINDLLRAGFGPLAKGTTKNFQNLAIQHNKPAAVTGFYPDVALAYHKIIWSKGSLTQAEQPTAEWVSEGIKFSWEMSPNTAWPATEDQVMLLAYCVARREHFSITAGAKRKIGWDILTIPANFQQEQFELYISFIAEDRQDVADSQYLGLLSI